MRTFALLLVVVAVAGCDAAVGGTGEEKLALQVEVNEALTVSHLRSLVGAQSQAKSLGVVDVDEDGAGEFGYIGELSGAMRLRGSGAGLKLPLLSADFKNQSSGGAVEVHGYLFRVYLPAETGRPVPVGEADDVSPELATDEWACYAWPVRYGVTGKRTFFVDASGVIRALDDPTHSGANQPEPTEALGRDGSLVEPASESWGRVDD